MTMDVDKDLSTEQSKATVQLAPRVVMFDVEPQPSPAAFAPRDTYQSPASARRTTSGTHTTSSPVTSSTPNNSATPTRGHDSSSVSVTSFQATPPPGQHTFQSTPSSVSSSSFNLLNSHGSSRTTSTTPRTPIPYGGAGGGGSFSSDQYSPANLRQSSSPFRRQNASPPPRRMGSPLSTRLGGSPLPGRSNSPPRRGNEKKIMAPPLATTPDSRRGRSLDWGSAQKSNHQKAYKSRHHGKYHPYGRHVDGKSLSGRRADALNERRADLLSVDGQQHITGTPFHEHRIRRTPVVPKRPTPDSQGFLHRSQMKRKLSKTRRQQDQHHRPSNNATPCPPTPARTTPLERTPGPRRHQHVMAELSEEKLLYRRVGVSAGSRGFTNQAGRNIAQMPSGSQIGFGTEAIVYRICDDSDGAMYAIKVSKDQFHTQKAKERAEKELSYWAELDGSQYVVPLCEAWQYNRRIYAIMPLLPGGNLSSYADLLYDSFDRPEYEPYRYLPDMYIWRFIHDAACALAHIHGKGFLHNDVKPSNFFVGESSRGPGFHLKLGDFGKLMRVGEDSEDGDGKYMDFGAPADALSDIFCLGMSMFEIAADVETLPETGSLHDNFRQGIIEDLQDYREQDVATAIRGMLNPNRSARLTASQLTKLDKVREYSTTVLPVMFQHVEQEKQTRMLAHSPSPRVTATTAHASGTARTEISTPAQNRSEHLEPCRLENAFKDIQVDAMTSSQD